MQDLIPLLIAAVAVATLFNVVLKRFNMPTGHLKSMKKEVFLFGSIWPTIPWTNLWRQSN